MKLLYLLILGALAGCALDASETLLLDRVWWAEPGALSVSLWTPGEGSFVLETTVHEVRGAIDCLGARCVVTFPGAIAPQRVVHLGEHHRAAIVRECGDDPFGLCPFGQTCVDRACVPLCGPTQLDGACILDGAVCLDGWCGFLGEG